MPSPARSHPPPRARRSQAERSAATRARLLDASVECLIEAGLAGTTTLAVCARAGVSHGSLLHHYGTRDRLLGAALDAVYERLRSTVTTRLEALPRGEARVEALVDLMWEAFGAPEFKAVVELWLAGANRPDLSGSIWPEARAFDAAIFPLARGLFPDIAARLPEFDAWIGLLFQALQGMGLARATWPREPDAEAMRARIRGLLSRVLREAFRDAGDA